ncbi:MAG: site-specific integrase [Planctomycetes bacterium]|nr:site-specific integrase [Planctomycetota bacterium]
MARTRTRNVVKRKLKDGYRYYLRVMRGGRRYLESLGTDNKDVARERARAKLQAIEAGRFEALAMSRARRPYATIGEIVQAYRRALATHAQPSPSTQRNNVSSLRKILRRGAGVEDPEAASAALLTGALVRAYARAVIPDGGPDRERRMRSVSSDLRQARSVFKRALRSAYRDLELPDLGEFMDERPCGNPPAERQEYSEEELTILRSGAQLRDSDPALYVVWMLGYYLALRAGEIAAARWSWIEEADGRIEMRICRRPEEGFDPKGYSGWVPLAPDVYQELLRYRRPDDPYIVPGGNRTNRYQAVVERLSDWMRGQGWRRLHCSHELRAYRGQCWRAAYGLDTARDWLRHAASVTTARHYTVNHNTASPALGMERKEVA